MTRRHDTSKIKKTGRLIQRQCCGLFGQLRQMTALFLAVLLAFGLAACGGAGSAAQEQASGENAADASAESGSEALDFQAEETGEAAAANRMGDSDGTGGAYSGGQEDVLSVVRSTYSSYVWGEEEDRLLAYFSCEFAGLTEEEAQAHPMLGETLNRLEEDTKAELEAAALEMAEEVGAFTDSDAEEGVTLGWTRGARVLRADSHLLSVLYRSQMKLGDYVFGIDLDCLNLDAETGETLALSDVLSDPEALSGLVESALAAWYADLDYYEGTDVASYLEEYLDDIPWTLDYTGLTLYFGPFELAPYPQGVQVVHLSFDEAPGLVKEVYRDVPAAWASEYGFEEPFYLDVDGDAASEELILSGTMNDYGWYEGISLSIDGIWYEFEADGAEFSPVLIQTAEGARYLYVVSSAYAGQDSTRILGLSGEGVFDAGSAGGFPTPLTLGDSPEDAMRTMVLTDPTSFSVTRVLSGLFYTEASRLYRVAPSGAMEPLERFETLRDPETIRLLQEMSFDVVTEAGEPTGEQRQLAPGEEGVWFRSEGEDRADVRFGGEILSFPVVHDEIGTTVNGVNVWDLIEIVYKGMEPDELLSEADAYPGGLDDDGRQPGEELLEGSSAWNPAVIQRQVIFDAGAAAGVVYLGYADASIGSYSENRGAYQQFFEDTGYAEDFPFLRELPEDHFVSTGGGEEIFAIIPLSPEAEVVITRWVVGDDNDWQGEAGEMLYYSSAGAPVVLRCNFSDIMPDSFVLVSDPEMEVLRWTPFLSGMDGRVVTETQSGSLYDLTVYYDDWGDAPSW